MTGKLFPGKPPCMIRGTLGLWLWLAGLVPAFATVYPRIEAAFNLPLATDPFDHVASDVRVQWRLPDNSTFTVPAFYDGGTTWRVRLTPRAAGQHEITAIILNGSPAAYTGLTSSNWFVTGPPSGPGFVRLDPAHPTRFVTDDGRRFFPIGHNVGWNPTVSNDFPRMFQRMGAAGENWTRIWMTHFYESLNLDWPKVDNTFGKLNLTVARRWDLILDEAEKAGLGIQMVFQHHGQYSTSVNPNWNDNPYNTAKGGFLSHPTQFFTNTTAKALTQRKLRYAIARWGSSPAIMAWELWNEVQYTDAAYSNQWSQIAAWHDEMAAFLRAQDPYAHLITTSSDLTRDYWGSMDYYQHHNYASDMVASSRDATLPPPHWPVRPTFDGESASIRQPPRVWVQAPLWASLMSGQGGASCPWWWDTNIDPENGYSLFKSASDFLSLSGLAAHGSLAKKAPRMTASQYTSLSFAPTGGWGPAAQDLWTVEDAVPAGFTATTRYLQGSFHRAFTPNGYRFLVNYGVPGTFSVQVLEIAGSGANLRVQLNGVTHTNINFPAPGGATNISFHVAIPAGAHTVTLTNAGQDWLVLGNLTLNPYVAMLGAYAVGATNFQAAWVWHRTNLYVTNATATLTGAVEVRNLQAGTYTAAWWDSFNGGVLSNFTVSIPTHGAVASVPTPAIARSAALYVGQPPQAALSGPALTQTLVTNTPPLWTALTLSNSGGLPLPYSLALTGVNAVTYTAVNSLEAGGPQYRWRDVSAYGTELQAAAFSALAPPKNARDEGIAGPFDIGFVFPFFSGAQAPGEYTQVYVSPNGFLSFSPFAGDRSVNQPLPHAGAPANLVALFWDDLDLSAGGKLWVASDPLAGEFTVQYDAVRIKNSALTITAQVVLRTTGEIVLYYKALGQTNSATVGLQNANGTQGMLVTHNSFSYLRSGLAVRVSPAAWLHLPTPAGVVPGGGSEALNIGFLPGSLPPGDYTATLVVRTGDPLQPAFQQPVALTLWDGQLTALEQWRQTYFGTTQGTGLAADDADWDGDDQLNIFEYAFHTNPTNANASPIQFELTDDHLVLTFPRTRPPPPDITYLVEVTDDLMGGAWQSGPAHVTEAIADNRDGTETVRLTVTALVSATVDRYVRLRISVP